MFWRDPASSSRSCSSWSCGCEESSTYFGDLTCPQQARSVGHLACLSSRSSGFSSTRCSGPATHRSPNAAEPNSRGERETGTPRPLRLDILVRVVSSESSSRGAAANAGVKRCPPRDAARSIAGGLRERVHRWVTVFAARLRQRFGGESARSRDRTGDAAGAHDRRASVTCPDAVQGERDRGAVERALMVRRMRRRRSGGRALVDVGSGRSSR